MRLSSFRSWEAVGSIVVVACMLTVLTACGVKTDDDGALEVPIVAGQRSPTVAGEPRAASPDAAAPASPRATATPAPAVASGNPSPSTQLAYFHNLSSNGEPPELLARRADLIVLTDGDTSYRDQLRAAGYNGLILQYLNASQVNGPGPYPDANAPCDSAFKPQRNGIARDAGVFCDELNVNEEWFLHNGAGQRLYSIIGESSIWYHMNPGNPGWQAFASQQIARDVVGPTARGFDGLLLDNVELSLTRLRTQAWNSDGVVKEYTSDDAYQAAWSDYLRQIRVRVGSDIPVWASLVSDPNTGATWSRYLPQLDGVLSPAFATGYDPLTVAEWQNNLSQAETALAAGKGLAAVGIGAQGDESLQQFALASYLLVTDGADAYFRYMSNASDEAVVSLWLYPNYAITLGAALGPRATSGMGWRREFQCGYVEVDPVNRRGTIVQTACRNGTVP